MSLIVYALGAYPTYSRDETPWEQADYNVNKLVKALKGEPFKGYAEIPIKGGKKVRFDAGDTAPAFALFSAWAAGQLKQLELEEFTIVPVPSSTCTSYDCESAPMLMARAIHDRLKSKASFEQWLRFVKVMPKSHQGGTRKQTVFEENLRISNLATRGSEVVLVDDVITSGSHLRACASQLRERGLIVRYAIVAAQAVGTQHATPYKIEPQDIE